MWVCKNVSMLPLYVRTYVKMKNARSEGTARTLMRSALDARGDNTRCDDQCMDGVRNTSFAWIQTADRMRCQ